MAKYHGIQGLYLVQLYYQIFRYFLKSIQTFLWPRVTKYVVVPYYYKLYHYCYFLLMSNYESIHYSYPEKPTTLNRYLLPLFCLQIFAILLHRNSIRWNQPQEDYTITERSSGSIFSFSHQHTCQIRVSFCCRISQLSWIGKKEKGGHWHPI